ASITQYTYFPRLATAESAGAIFAGCSTFSCDPRSAAARPFLPLALPWATVLAGAALRASFFPDFLATAAAIARPRSARRALAVAFRIFSAPAGFGGCRRLEHFADF